MHEVMNFIGGQWVPAGSGRTFENLNPATGEPVATCPDSGSEDATDAVAAAHRALPAWRRLPAPARGQLLLKAASLFIERKRELARLLTTEVGKTLSEAEGDVQEAIDVCLYMAGEGRRLFGKTVPSELPDKFAMTVRDPLGVIVMVAAWNFPIAVPSWKIAPALVAGNTVIFKPAPSGTATGAAMVRVFADAGFPPGVINMVSGGGAPVVDPMLEDPRVAGISFTGSNQSGTAVAVKAAQHGKRVSLELGGKNAVIVMEDADLDLAVDGTIWAAFGTSGQRCTSCSRVLVHEDVQKAYLGKLAQRVRTLRLGNGLDPAVQVGPIVNRAQLDRVRGYVALAKEEGCGILTGGDLATGGELSSGLFFQPTILTGVRPEYRVAREEIFGPVLSIIPVRSLDEAIEINNSVIYGLSAGIFTRDINRAYRAMRDISTGIVYINAGTTGAEAHLPFGGRNGTGNGHREIAWTAFDFCTEWKTIYVDFSGRLQRAQLDTAALSGGSGQ